MRKIVFGLFAFFVLGLSGCVLETDRLGGDGLDYATVTAGNEGVAIATPTVMPGSVESAIPIEETNGIQLTVAEDYDYRENGLIPFKIRNTTGEKIYFTAIPHLEVKEGGVWAEVPLEGPGFCGVPDGVEDVYSGDVLLSWYGGELAAGEYRLTYNVVDGMEYTFIETISDEFTVK